jgi:putative metallohydrolase (TIGR04338 family)
VTIEAAVKFLDSISNLDHRRFAGQLLNGVSLAEIDWSGVADRVQDMLIYDVKCIKAGAEPFLYARHRRQVERRVARRKQTQSEGWGSSRVRDSQRTRLYTAERVIRKQGRTFDSIEEIQAYVDRLTASAWWKRRYPERKITVVPKHHGAATAWSWRSRIEMPRWSWCEAVVLHEVAHIATDRKYGSSAAAHGREYARTFLELVRHKMGKDAGADLKASFTEHRVKHSLPRKPMSEEQRAAAAERLATARAAKGQ